MAVGIAEKVGDVGQRRAVAALSCAAERLRRAFEEERHRNLEDMRNFLQPAGADAVGALFVFLDLLERQAELIADCVRSSVSAALV